MSASRKPIAITSESNTLFRAWLSLHDSQGIKKENSYLLGGRKILTEISASPDQLARIHAVVIREEPTGDEDRVIRSLLNATPEGQRPPKTYSLSNALFRQLDLLGLGSPLLVMEKPDVGAWDPLAEPKGLEVLCALGDPQNVGALLRSCEAFGVDRVIILKESATPFHPRSVRASAGATLRLKFSQGPSVKDLPSQILNLVLLDLSGEELPIFKWPKAVRLLMGEEGLGLPPGLSGLRVKIPMNPKLESLNAAVAAGIALYSFRLQNKM